MFSHELRVPSGVSRTLIPSVRHLFSQTVDIVWNGATSVQNAGLSLVKLDARAKPCKCLTLPGAHNKWHNLSPAKQGTGLFFESAPDAKGEQQRNLRVTFTSFGFAAVLRCPSSSYQSCVEGAELRQHGRSAFAFGTRAKRPRTRSRAAQWHWDWHRWLHATNGHNQRPLWWTTRVETEHTRTRILAVKRRSEQNVAALRTPPSFIVNAVSLAMVSALEMMPVPLLVRGWSLPRTTTQTVDIIHQHLEVLVCASTLALEMNLAVVTQDSSRGSPLSQFPSASSSLSQCSVGCVSRVFFLCSAL